MSTFQYQASPQSLSLIQENARGPAFQYSFVLALARTRKVLPGARLEMTFRNLRNRCPICFLTTLLPNITSLTSFPSGHLGVTSHASLLGVISRASLRFPQAIWKWLLMPHFTSKNHNWLMSQYIFSISKFDDDHPLIYRTGMGIHMKGCESSFLTKNGRWRRGRLGISGWQSPTLGLGLCPWIRVHPHGDRKADKTFFQRRWEKGSERASPAVSLPPLAQASAPDSGSTLMEDFNSTQKISSPTQGRRGRRSVASLPPSLSSVSPTGRVHPHGALWLSVIPPTCTQGKSRS